MMTLVLQLDLVTRKYGDVAEQMLLHVVYLFDTWMPELYCGLSANLGA